MITVIADASAFKESSCDLRLFLTTVEGYKGKNHNNDIEFGSAFHKFRAALRNGAGFEVGMIMARNHYNEAEYTVKSNKKYLTTKFLELVCGGYATKYANDALVPVITPHDIALPNGDVIPRGSPLIEPTTRFAFPYYVDDVCEILIAGTIDELAQWKGTSGYVIVDAKTTSVWDVETYFRSYNLNPQMITYRWAIRQYALAYPDSFLALIDQQEVSAMIDGIFYAGETKPPEYRRSKPIIFSEQDIEEFGVLVKEKVAELVLDIHKFVETGKLPLRKGFLNGSCQTPYGPCKFFNVCAAPDAESRESILESHFNKGTYNPLTHGD
jgi:hypothetical protein